MNIEDNFKRNSKDNFDKQACDYENGHDGRFVKIMYNEIVRRVEKINPESILDVGCGTGNILSILRQKCDSKLYGMDISENMIKKAKMKLGKYAEFKVGDSEFMPWKDNSFEMVVCNASFHHYPNPEKVLSEMKRVLVPKGTLIIGDPTAPFIFRQLLNFCCKRGSTGDYRIYSMRELEGMLEKCGLHVFEASKINYKSFALSACSIK